MSNTQDLERQIEELVREHLAECHRAVRGAVARAFEASSGDAAPRRRRVRSQVGNAKRRTPGEVAALGERLYAAMCATPGETVTILAGQLETTTRALQVPLKRLKRSGRVRSVGQRHSTRYFPMSADEDATRPVMHAVAGAS